MSLTLKTYGNKLQRIKKAATGIAAFSGLACQSNRKWVIKGTGIQLKERI
jgi:hypothetical protein